MITSRPIPVTDHIRNTLLERINNNYYDLDGKLPSEFELCREFSASRASVRTAIAALAERGYIIRRPGLGSYLAPVQRLEGGLERLESMLTMARKHKLPTRLANLEVSLVTVDEFLADRLSLDPDETVTRVSRTILIGETPVSHQVDHVPSQYLQPDQVNRSFGGSVLDLLRQGRNLDIPNGITEITAVEADESMRERLKLNKPSALILIERKAVQLFRSAR